jgi:hypothetical protein
MGQWSVNKGGGGLALNASFYNMSIQNRAMLEAQTRLLKAREKDSTRGGGFRRVRKSNSHKFRVNSGGQLEKYLHGGSLGPLISDGLGGNGSLRVDERVPDISRMMSGRGAREGELPCEALDTFREGG